jgi:hypothetical protein
MKGITHLLCIWLYKDPFDNNNIVVKVILHLSSFPILIVSFSNMIFYSQFYIHFIAFYISKYFVYVNILYILLLYYFNMQILLDESHPMKQSNGLRLVFCSFKSILVLLLLKPLELSFFSILVLKSLYEISFLGIISLTIVPNHFSIYTITKIIAPYCFCYIIIKMDTST